MLTIGEFSRLCHVSARMLRHYDQLHLLPPAYTDEATGYRYYHQQQIKIVLQIEKLKSYGFQLLEIKDMLKLAEDELNQLLHTKMLEQYNTLNALRKTLRQMEDETLRYGGINALKEKYRVTVMQCPAQRVFGIRKTINIGQVHELFREVRKAMEGRGITRAGTSQLVFLGEEYSYESMDVEAQYEVAGDHPDIKTIPERLCIATVHTGPYEDLRKAYDAIASWLLEHPEYEVTAGSIERYIRDEESAGSAEEYETGVLFPAVKKA